MRVYKLEGEPPWIWFMGVSYTDIL